MRRLANQNLILCSIVTFGLSTLLGCVSYGPAVTGSELPFVPVVALDTVATVATGVYGTVAWPLTYEVDNSNHLVGIGGYQTRGLPQVVEESTGWSFVYGGMAYAGGYETNHVATAYSYTGGMLHGAARWHMFSDRRSDLVLEPALSFFYEGGNYLRFRQQNAQEMTTQRPGPVSATLQFSQLIHYRFNDDWVITGVYTTGLPLDNLFSKYSFSGTLALTRGSLTAWTRPGVHINVLSLTRLTDWTLGIGISHCLRNNRTTR